MRNIINVRKKLIYFLLMIKDLEQKVQQKYIKKESSY